MTVNATISDSLRQLIGKPAWGLHRSHGSMFLFDIGEAVPRSERKTHGEWCLLFESCIWRFEDVGNFAITSVDNSEQIEVNLDSYSSAASSRRATQQHPNDSASHSIRESCWKYIRTLLRTIRHRPNGFFSFPASSLGPKQSLLSALEVFTRRQRPTNFGVLRWQTKINTPNSPEPFGHAPSSPP
jgi:hypothetical protein